MSQQSPSAVPRFAKKFEPYKAIIVGVIAIVVSLGSIAALGSHYTSSLDKKADITKVDNLSQRLSAEEAVHQDVQRRLERIEDRVGSNHDEVMNAISELKAMMRRR